MKQEEKGIIFAKKRPSKCYNQIKLYLFVNYQINCPFLSLRNLMSFFLSFILVILPQKSGFSLAAYFAVVNSVQLGVIFRCSGLS